MKNINHTFITSVPKKIPNCLGDFRPTACCNFLYKIISTILSNKIIILLKKIISENRNAHIPGRFIAENTLLAHELLRNFNQTGKKNTCIKIDLHKAFNKINRNFIIFMMRQLGFNEIFCNLVKECICNVIYYILIDGSRCGFIHNNRGIRQGDPLSPYLFTLAMEYFTLQMENEQLNTN